MNITVGKNAGSTPPTPPTTPDFTTASRFYGQEGADPQQKNSAGKTAFDLAKKKAKSPLASEFMSPKGGRFHLFGDG